MGSEKSYLLQMQLPFSTPTENQNNSKVRCFIKLEVLTTPSQSPQGTNQLVEGSCQKVPVPCLTVMHLPAFLILLSEG